MRKILSTVFAIAMVSAAGAALAEDDASRAGATQRTVGGAELVYAESEGIDSATHTNAFWYAGTSGWPSE